MAPTAPLHPFPWIDLAIILALVVMNGVFAMSELAIVSARGPRLEAMARARRSGAATALRLREDPGKFLSTVQIGITLTGIVAGAFSGASLGAPVAERLALLGVPVAVANEMGFALVIAITTYASLIVGELVPKQFALRSPEPIAATMAVPMLWLSRATAPVVWLLDQSSALVFRLLGLNRESETQVTAEELHLIVAEASSAGVIEESERQIISGVVRLADRPVREIMTPRNQVEWLDIAATSEEIAGLVRDVPFSRLPVAEGSVESIRGVVLARDLLIAVLDGRALDLAAMLREVPVVPDQMDAMDALVVLRGADVPMALVHDEYGHFEGIVTPANLLAAIAGTFVSDAGDGHDPALVERADGSWLISGSLAADAMAERLGFDLPEDRDYATAAGFVLAVMKRLPVTGDLFAYDGWRFEVVDMDGRKIDKLLATRRIRGEA
ncbi:hemolysin family protein [Sphingomonas quercus]|uniref:Hemolysin family protein n=1 Tax=Sphingomonas quercus TaxID=2842451 RepID=A0ABS6BIM5_9SPHN|nr:hemolysin family protein [Sphingomonas quercus]MBU3077035.1 hemolysin family protein [Sphingomonas quercus]